MFSIAGSPVSVTYSDDGVDTLIRDHYTSLVSQLQCQRDRLTSSSLREYTHLEELTDLSKHLSSHLNFNKEHLSSLVKGISETRQELDLLNSCILEKIKNEGVESWVTPANQGKW